MKNIVCALFVLCCGAANASLTQLTDPSSLVLSNDFESSVNNADATFSSANFSLASTWSGSVTPSGVQGISSFSSSAPLVGTLSSPTTAMGIWFGNDDFGLVFNAFLEVFNGLTSLGSVSVASNANDYADQFIGLTSTIAFDSFQLSYQRPAAQGLYIYADDLYLGEASVSSIPEPASLALLGLGLIGIFFSTRKKAV